MEYEILSNQYCTAYSRVWRVERVHKPHETAKKMQLSSIHTTTLVHNCNDFLTVLYMGNDFLTALYMGNDFHSDFVRKNLCSFVCSVRGPSV